VKGYGPEGGRKVGRRGDAACWLGPEERKERARPRERKVGFYFFYCSNPFLFSLPNCFAKDLKTVQINLEFECRGGDRGNKNSFIV
jgi:hypothetical protein